MAHESLKLFRDIAQTRSFSRGAELNSISQSAASQQMQELEHELGVQLLDRSTRPLVVTAAGQLPGAGQTDDTGADDGDVVGPASGSGGRRHRAKA